MKGITMSNKRLCSTCHCRDDSVNSPNCKPCKETPNGWSNWRGDAFKLPETPKVAVDCIVEYHHKLVVIERKFKPLGYAWPGGFMDVGETCYQAAVREAGEETNLKVEIIDLVGVFSKPDRDPRGHVISLVYIAEGHGYLKAKDDAKEVHLFTLDEVLKLDMVVDHKRMLMTALEHPKFDRRRV
jgi:8-oxo-dGTP diphosphatase